MSKNVIGRSIALVVMVGITVLLTSLVKDNPDKIGWSALWLAIGIAALVAVVVVVVRLEDKYRWIVVGVAFVALFFGGEPLRTWILGLPWIQLGFALVALLALGALGFLVLTPAKPAASAACPTPAAPAAPRPGFHEPHDS